MTRWLVLGMLFVPRGCFTHSPSDSSGYDEHDGGGIEDGYVSRDNHEVRDAAVMDEKADPISTRPSFAWMPTTHLPGTLLRDRHERFWVVDRWPDRRELLPWLFADSHYRREEAIPLTAEEERCLRASTNPWIPSLLWQLARLPDGRFWYLDEGAHYRRLARPVVITAWRDDPRDAVYRDFTSETFETQFRDLGPMPPPNGALFRQAATYFLYVDGSLAPFADEGLMRAVGYRSEYAIPLTVSERDALAPLAATLTQTTFSVCPLAAAELRRTEDRDGDGVPYFEDCDDESAVRFPGHPELCDGIDNDCDLVIDNGFDVGTRCFMDNPCHTPTYRRCAFDRLHTECENDEVICSE